MKHFFSFLLLCAMACNALRAQTVEPNWESINSRPYPKWFSDAKLGIFIHWGLYSVPAFTGFEGYGEWYYRGLMTNSPTRLAFHKKNYGEDFQYADFDKLFKAELFDANEWAQIFKNSGAKYVLLVSKHHDGYCLWNSKYAPKWNSVVGGPKRDIVAEVTEAVRRQNLKMGLYYSLPEWTNPLHIWTVSPHDSIANYVENHMIPQFKELVSTYKPSLVFTDGEWFNTAAQWHAPELIAWYYNLVGKDAIVNERWGHGTQHGFRTPEYSAGIADDSRPWAECRGFGRSFGLNRNEPLSNYISSDELIRHFVKLVASGGGLTLNVGPYADGKIPLIQQERLMALGKFLEINGEAIYETRPFHNFFEEKEVSVERIDTAINFNWVRNSPNPKISYDNFTAEWNGYLVPSYSENYTFNVEVDDNVKIVLDGKTIIDYNQNRAAAPESNAEEAKLYSNTQTSIKLKAGKAYKIQVFYQEINTNASVKIFWSSKSQTKEAVNAFYRDDKATEKGLHAQYKCKQPYVCYTTKGDTLYAIALEYPDEELRLKVDKPLNDFQIKLLGCNKVLPWRYENSTLIIDTKPLKYSDIKSTAAWVFRIR
ncbi:MAG: alpha-L-fucosidase [Bacteroidales bacterium]